MTIYEDFLYWILSLTEDNPVPYEVKHIYFEISFNTGICSLSFCGSEIFESPVKSYEYYPLEAHWFRNNSFHNIKEVYLAKVTVKELIQKAFENVVFSRKFKNKNIHICERGNQVEYTYGE